MMVSSENKPLKMQNALLCGAALWLCVGAAAIQAQTPKLPDGPGKATTERVCGSCHGAELVVGRQESRDGWSAVVGDMVQRGATGTEDELAEVVDYLATNFPKGGAAGAKINVNKANAADLQTALGITDKQAASIVQYRTDKGDFKSADDLEKVPGIDASKIEAKKSKLAF